MLKIRVSNNADLERASRLAEEYGVYFRIVNHHLTHRPAAVVFTGRPVNLAWVEARWRG